MKKLLLTIFVLAFSAPLYAATLKVATVTPEGSPAGPVPSACDPPASGGAPAFSVATGPCPIDAAGAGIPGAVPGASVSLEPSWPGAVAVCPSRRDPSWSGPG